MEKTETKAQRLRAKRNGKIIIAVQQLRGLGANKPDAIKEVAEDFGVSSYTVLSILNKNAKQLKNKTV